MLLTVDSSNVTSTEEKNHAQQKRENKISDVERRQILNSMGVNGRKIIMNVKINIVMITLGNVLLE